ncbi:hypothetical protein RhiirA1_451803 [Rhizophagus irregularis]|uniref:Chromo domain-containing protein n=1 Tax=Rhizophagus irregularis TaxID=588596 RepID=A0A2N0SBJ2_9GLOM|nr:hypothetical protein RhiirA1_451803 [Rhizophagus irregularis]
MPLKRRQPAKTSLKDSSKESLPLIASIESDQQNSSLINATDNSSNKRVPLYISEIIDIRFVFGEQYAKVVFEDKSFEPQWEPVKNIKRAEGLILKFQQKREKEEREERLKELEAQSNNKDNEIVSNDYQDSEDKTVFMQQNSCPTTFVNSSARNNTDNYNYDSKLKSVKFAQELVNAKTFSNDEFLQVQTLTKEIQLENTNNYSPIKLKATPKPILRSALRTSNKRQLETLQWKQWNGILLKGKTREFVAKVIIKTLKEGPGYNAISDKLGSNNVFCMANTVPLSYALSLIGEDKELGDVLIMECESGNLKDEQDHMMFHKLVAFIRLENDYNGLHLFVFSDYRWIYKNQFNQEHLFLVARNIKIKQNYLLIQQPLIKALDNETTYDTNYCKAKTELHTGDYNDIITKLCKKKPNFTVYARPKLGETDSIITVMKVLGANYFPNYDCDKMDLVLVHVLMLDQINFMPNLIKLKHQEQCKFLVYGWDFKQQEPIKFEEYFVSGGILSVTTRVLLEEKNGLQRIFEVIEYQKENGVEWKILMDPEIKYCNYNLSALIDYDLKSNNSFDESGINFHYFDLFLWRKLKKQNDNNISRIYYALLFSYSFEVEANIIKSPRHCILIAHNKEMPFCPKIPGVEVITLENFEETFGFDDTMEWE